MDTAFHKLDRLERNQAIQTEWIEYLEAERVKLMARIDDLEGIVSQIVNDYAGREQEKQALEDRIGAAADKLRDAHATLTGQAASDTAPAPSVSDQAPAETETPANVRSE